MADLTDDQHARLREIAECDPMELWGQDDIDDLRECLPALLDEIERLGDRVADLELDNEGLQRTLAENDRLRERIADLTETVRAEADVPQQDGRLRGALVLRDACDKAEKS